MSAWTAMSLRGLTDAKVCQPVPAHGLDTGMNDLDGLALDQGSGLEDENANCTQNNPGRTIRTDVLTATELESIWTSFWTIFGRYQRFGRRFERRFRRFGR